jgi:hypothetical protein
VTWASGLGWPACLSLALLDSPLGFLSPAQCTVQSKNRCLHFSCIVQQIKGLFLCIMYIIQHCFIWHPQVTLFGRMLGLNPGLLRRSQ